MNEIYEQDGKQYIARPVITRDDVIGYAVDKCLDLMFRASYPSITLDEYRKQLEKMTEEGKENTQLFYAYYLPLNAYEAIKEDIADAYNFKSQLPEIIDVLKDFFKKPIVDLWIDGDDENELGHRGYTRPEPMDEETYEKATKFLDMANDYFDWDRDLKMFYFNVAYNSPCSNREAVEKWWHEHGDTDFKLPDDSYWIDIPMKK